MNITNKQTYSEVDARMEELLQKGSRLGGMDFLSETEKEEFRLLSEAAYEWECQTDPHPWQMKPNLVATMNVASCGLTPDGVEG